MQKEIHNEQNIANQTITGSSTTLYQAPSKPEAKGKIRNTAPVFIENVAVCFIMIVDLNFHF